MQPLSRFLLLTSFFCCKSLAAPLAQRQQQNDRSLPAGAVITGCAVPNTIALTFDDGPNIPTTLQVLDHLKEAGMQATFFVNGANYRNIYDDDTAAVVKRMLREGHQIGSHTWSHPMDLRELNKDEIRSQMTQLDDAFYKVIGKIPRVMRAPNLFLDEKIADVMKELDYAMVQVDFNTFDWENQSKEEREKILQRWEEGFNADNRLFLAHDTLKFTAEALVPKMIENIRSKGLKAVSVCECLGVNQDACYKDKPVRPNNTKSVKEASVSPDENTISSTGEAEIVRPTGDAASEVQGNQPLASQEQDALTSENTEDPDPLDFDQSSYDPEAIRVELEGDTEPS